MNWTELTIYVKKEGIELLASALEDIGINSIAIEDPDEMKNFIKDNSDKWDLLSDEVIESIKSVRPNVKIYVSDKPEYDGKLMQINTLLSDLKENDTENIFNDITTQTNFIKDEDWENNWKQYFKPLSIGEKLYVVPQWEKADVEDNKILITIDPGTSFGSGMHETTQMCMTSLEEYLIPGDVVIDVGSGSGILSVTAAKLGAAKVISTDIDEKAVSDTKATILLNEVQDICEVQQADILEGYNHKVDIIVGNLFSNIIIHLAPIAKDVIKKEGLLITSGIIEDSLNDVLDAYEKNSFEIVETVSKGDWYCVVGQKR